MAQRTVRMNAYSTRDRAMEEANGLKLAFANSPLASRPCFDITVTPFNGEFIVNITADVDTSTEGFLSIIIARTLAAHCRAPARQPVAVITNTIAVRALASRPPRMLSRHQR